jgi:sugar-specific transcriptional regulator TrmB
MADNIKDVLQELSELLNRISQQNQESLQRQEEFRSKMHGQRERDSELGQEQQHTDQIKLKVDEISCNAEKNMWLSDKQGEKDLHLKERLLEMLDRHNQVLESVIGRLKESPKKGRL